MNYYKASTNAKSKSGDFIAITDIKASERNYSHAVITVAIVMNETYYDGTPNPSFGKRVSVLSFHQGLENAQKAADGTTHACLGGGYEIVKGRLKGMRNANRSTVIVETELVSSKEYRDFKANALTGSQLDILLNA